VPPQRTGVYTGFASQANGRRSPGAGNDNLADEEEVVDGIEGVCPVRNAERTANSDDTPNLAAHLDGRVFKV
jgi:hypothetical protein